MLDVSSKPSFSYFLGIWTTNAANNLSGTKGQESCYSFLKGNKSFLLPTPMESDRSVWGETHFTYPIRKAVSGWSGCFSLFPILNNQNVEKRQYWYRTSEAFCSQQSPCSLPNLWCEGALCSSQFGQLCQGSAAFYYNLLIAEVL